MLWLTTFEPGIQRNIIVLPQRGILSERLDDHEAHVYKCTRSFYRNESAPDLQRIFIYLTGVQVSHLSFSEKGGHMTSYNKSHRKAIHHIMQIDIVRTAAIAE
ncbi:hypothetical protein OS493_019346 [Desmophyllum pertusum]|uniref:Uncharacterized protein n=1 Tax=Desmophyllum pertusum TaxID=174260 RepID=A0A9X0D8Z4_9CNID|nr:hypothetical protein OS493_019346 [Desmophyllum pertusum]